MMTPRALLSSAQYSIFLLAAIDVIRCHSISFDVIDWTLAFAIELSATEEVFRIELQSIEYYFGIGEWI